MCIKCHVQWGSIDPLCHDGFYLIRYGDLTPRSVIARSVAMTWFMVGLVLNGIIIGFITTALTTLGLPQEIKLYNTKVRRTNDLYSYMLLFLKF